MVVDGAIVMVENIVRHLGHQERVNKPVRDRIRDAAHEVQRPVFYAITIIITAYLPIFTLQRVEGRLFRTDGLDRGLRVVGRGDIFYDHRPGSGKLSIPQRDARMGEPGAGLDDKAIPAVPLPGPYITCWAMIVVSVAAVGCSVWLLQGERIGSEFLPHLDEGALWVRGTLAPSTGPTEGVRLSNQARLILCSFPEVTQCSSQTGRPDDGSDTTSFFNTEYFADLKPKEQWRPAFHQNKDELIAAMNRELSKLPGVVWGFSQPIADNMEEAVSGVKGQLATKIYGDDLRVLEDRAEQIVNVMRTVRGITDLGIFRVVGQPNDNFIVDREQAARYQLNVADVQDAINTAAGGNALTQVLQGEARYDLVMRYLPQFRSTKEAIENIRLAGANRRARFARTALQNRRAGRRR
jgi:cobalt-zinc-cadmium resistance protein CzcA